MIKTLAGSIRQYKKQTIMSPVTVALEVFFEIMIPLIMAKLIDEGIDQGDMGVYMEVWIDFACCGDDFIVLRCHFRKVCGTGFIWFCKEPASGYLL